MSRIVIILLIVCVFLPAFNTCSHVTVRSKCNRFWKRVTGHMSDSVLPNRTITFAGLPPCDLCVFTYPIGSTYIPVGDYHLIQHYRRQCPTIHENHMTFRTSAVSLTCICNVSGEKEVLYIHSKAEIEKEPNWKRNDSSEIPPKLNENDTILQERLALCLKDINPIPHCVPKFGSIDLNIENLTTFIKSVHREGQDVDSIQMFAEPKDLETVKITADYNGLLMKALQHCFEQIDGFYDFLINRAVRKFFATDLRDDGLTITELDKNLTCTLY
uniref:Uncharacterized protein n=1 Tax=Strigamia maritima TaxID=126957 RepID=T1IJ79_STRMM